MPLIAMRDWPINHQYLMNKTKTELAYLVLDYYHALQDKDTEIAKLKESANKPMEQTEERCTCRILHPAIIDSSRCFKHR